MHSAGFEDCELEINVDIDLEEYIKRIGEVKGVLADNQMTISAIIGVVNGGFSTNAEVAEESLDEWFLMRQVIEGDETLDSDLDLNEYDDD